MTLQIILTTTEVIHYGNFLSNVQNERLIVIPDGMPSAKMVFGYLTFYISFIIMAFLFIIRRNGTALEGFILGACSAFLVDITMWSTFKNTTFLDLLTIIYDVLIVGGFGTGLSIYIFNNHKTFLQNYAIVFLLTIIAAFSILFYLEYQIEQHHINLKLQEAQRKAHQ